MTIKISPHEILQLSYENSYLIPILLKNGLTSNSILQDLNRKL